MNNLKFNVNTQFNFCLSEVHGLSVYLKKVISWYRLHLNWTFLFGKRAFSPERSVNVSSKGRSKKKVFFLTFFPLNIKTFCVNSSSWTFRSLIDIQICIFSKFNESNRSRSIYRLTYIYVWVIHCMTYIVHCTVYSLYSGIDCTVY